MQIVCILCSRQLNWLNVVIANWRVYDEFNRNNIIGLS